MAYPWYDRGALRNFRRGGMAAFPARRKMLPAHQPWNCASPPVGFRNPASPPPQHAGTIGPDCPGPGPQTRGIPAPSGRPLEAPPRAICTPGRAICLTGTAAALREFRLEAERATRQTGQTGQTEGHDDVRLAENCAHLAAWGVRHRPGRSGRTGIGRSPLPPAHRSLPSGWRWRPAPARSGWCLCPTRHCRVWL